MITVRKSLQIVGMLIPGNTETSHISSCYTAKLIIHSSARQSALCLTYCAYPVHLLFPLHFLPSLPLLSSTPPLTLVTGGGADFHATASIVEGAVSVTTSVPAGALGRTVLTARQAEGLVTMGSALSALTVGNFSLSIDVVLTPHLLSTITALAQC